MRRNSTNRKGASASTVLVGWVMKRLVFTGLLFVAVCVAGKALTEHVTYPAMDYVKLHLAAHDIVVASSDSSDEYGPDDFAAESNGYDKDGLNRLLAENY